MAHRLPRLAAAVLLALTSTACPDDSVPTTPLPGGLDLAGLLPSQRALVRATLEISGGALAETELDLDDDLQTLSGTFDVQNVTAPTERELRLRVYGRFAEDREEVLLGRVMKPITLQPEADVAIAFAADDVFDTCGGEAGACAVLFDANRNGVSNIDDLLERDRSAGRGIDPAPQAPYLVTSSEQLQFPSGVRLGSFARQLVVLENFGENPVEITRAAVVGGQGFAISILDPTGQSVAPPGRALTGDIFQRIAPGQEAFVAVSFTPVNSFVTTGALFVRVRDTVTLVEQTARVKLIANPEGELRPADVDYTEPAVESLSVDGGALNVVAFPNAQLQSGDALIAEDALGAGLRQTGASVALVDGEVTVDFPADAAFAVTVRAGERFSTAIDGLTSDIDIAVVDVADGAITGLACAECRSANAGTSPEAVEFKNDSSTSRTVAVLIGRIEPEVALPETEGGLTVAETVSFRCSTTLSIGPEFADVDPVQPTTGPLEGGIPVRLRGTGFDPRARVFVGEAEALDVSVETGADGVDVVSFTLPAAVGTENPASIIVENPQDPGDGQAATLLESFIYQPPAPVIDEVRPDLAPTTGGDTTVTIIGRFFSARHGAPSVTFGTVTVPATFVSASELTLNAPPHIDPDTAATVSVRVRNRIAADDNGAPVLGSASNGVAFRYLVPAGAAPTITAVDPAVGSIDGGIRVTVAGTDLRPGVRVFFGGREATCDVPTSTTAVSCLTPAADEPAAVDVIVVNADAQSAKRDGGYRYEIPAPSITSVFPPRGITDGGTFLVVEGGGFRPGARVTFVQGATSRDATAATRVSGTTMLVTTPPGTAGAAELVIRNLDGQSVTGSFTYFAPDQATPPPSITALSPAVGDAAGGYSVVITGTGFLNPSVLFGSQSVTATFVDRTPPALDELTVTAPPSPTGVAAAVTVQVINDDGQSATNGFNYTFSAAAPPRIDRIAPSTFVSGQTTAFTISGARFDAGAIVLVGGLQAAITARSSTSISATIGGQLPLGAVQVVVENPNGSAVSIPVQVVSATGAVQPAISAVSTSDVHADVAGDVITLFGAGLDQGPASVQVAAVGQADPARPARVLVQNPNFLVVELPAIPSGPRVLQASFETPAGTRSTLSPTVTVREPVVIFADGDTLEDGRVEIAMFGDFFNPAALTAIVLDNAEPIACDVTVATERAIRCTTAAPIAPGRTYDIRLSWTGRFDGQAQQVLERSGAALGIDEPLRGPGLDIVGASDVIRSFTDFALVPQTLTLDVPGLDAGLVPPGAVVEVAVGSPGDPTFFARGDALIDTDVVTTTLDEGGLQFFGTGEVQVAILVDGVELAFGFVTASLRRIDFANQQVAWSQPAAGGLDNDLPGDADRVVAVRSGLAVPLAATFIEKSVEVDTRTLAPGTWQICFSDQLPFCGIDTGSLFVDGLPEELEPNDSAVDATGINPFGRVAGVVDATDTDQLFFRLDADASSFNIAADGGCPPDLGVVLRVRGSGALVTEVCPPPQQAPDLVADEYVLVVSTASPSPTPYQLVVGGQGTGGGGGESCNANGVVEPGEQCDEFGAFAAACDPACREFAEADDDLAGLFIGLAPVGPVGRTLTPFDVDFFVFDVAQAGDFRLEVRGREASACVLSSASLQGPPGFIPLEFDGEGCITDEGFLPAGRYTFAVQASDAPFKYAFNVLPAPPAGPTCGDGTIDLAPPPSGNGVRTDLVSGLAFFGGVAAGVTVDGDGTAFIVENDAGRLRRRTAAGVTDDLTLSPIVLQNGADIEIGPDGFLYVADGFGLNTLNGGAGNRVLRVDPISGASTAFVPAINNPSGLAFDAAGNLLVASFSNRTISRFAPDGTPLGQFGPQLPVLPNDIEVAPNGFIVVAGFNPDLSRATAVVQLSPDGTSLSTFGDSGNIDIFDPHSLVFDGAGDLWVTYYNGATLARFAPGGQVVETFPGGFNTVDAPNGIAIDRQGSLYIVPNASLLYRLDNLAAGFGEECDDNGVAPGDGCSNTCTIEPGFACEGAPSLCTALCGNGLPDPGEQCDDENASDGDGCSTDCRVEVDFRCVGFGPGTCVSSPLQSLFTWGGVNDDLPVGNGRDLDVVTIGERIIAMSSYGNDISIAGQNFTASRFGATVFSLEPDNTVRWATSFTTDSDGDLSPRRIAVDPDSNDIFVVGTGFAGNAIVGGVPLGPQNGSCTPFIVRLDNLSGGVVWGRTFPTTNCGSFDGVAFDGPTVVAAGMYQTAIDFGDGFTLPGAKSTSQVMLATFDLELGETLSLFRLSNSTTTTEASALAVLPGGDRVVGGFYVGTSDVGGVTLTPNASLDAWWARFTPEGTPVHVKQAAGALEDRINHIVARPDGDYVVSGQYDGAITVEGTALSGSSFGFFMVRVAADATPLWVTGQTGGGGVSFGLRRFSLDDAGDVRFSSNISSNGSTLVGGVVVPSAPSNARAFVLSGETGQLVKQAVLDSAVVNLNGSALTANGRSVAIGQVGSAGVNSSGAINGLPFSAQSRDQIVVRWTF